MSGNALLITGVTVVVIYGLWHKLGDRKQPFVTLNASDSAVLPRNSERRGAESELPFAKLIRDKVPALAPDATFNGVWWLPGGDAQTMYCSVGDFSKVDPVVYERKFLQLPDKGIIAVDISPPLSSVPISPRENVLLVAHGLTGGSHEPYVRAVLARATPGAGAGGLGTRAVVLNFRGCNGSPVVTPRLYHAGSSDDVRHVVLWICHTFPECRIFGIGFSLGANILAKYAGEEGARCPLQALITLANPWDFVAGSHHLPGTFLGRHVYRWVLGDALRRLLRMHGKVLLDAAADLPVARGVLEDVFTRRSITLREYDVLVNAPLYGFENVYDYYSRISSVKVAGDICVPYLSINSADDPITGTGELRRREIHDNPWIALAVTRTGGHLGWFEYGPDGGITRWYVKPVLQFLEALIEYDLADRPKPRGVTVDGTDFVRDPERDDVGFRVLSQEQSELVVSGVEVSKLFSGW
ncbi:hypothetical protein VTO73DRAFT_9991 [Trametes versicolor]